MNTFSILFVLNTFLVFFISTGNAVVSLLLDFDKISSEIADCYLNVFTVLTIFLCISTLFNLVIGVKHGYIAF